MQGERGINFLQWNLDLNYIDTYLHIGCHFPVRSPITSNGVLNHLLIIKEN